jgi:hypothetical protein
MPGQLFKSYEFGVTKTTFSSDGFGTGSASFGKKFTKAFSTIRLVVPGSKSLTSQGLCAVSAGKTFTMPRVIAICYTTLSDHLTTFDTLCGKLVFITFCTVDIVFLGYEGLGTNWIMTSTTNKAFFMPLSCLVLHLFHACSEDITTSVTSGCELSIIAWPTVDPIGLGPKLFVN